MSESATINKINNFDELRGTPSAYYSCAPRRAPRYNLNLFVGHSSTFVVSKSQLDSLVNEDISASATVPENNNPPIIEQIDWNDVEALKALALEFEAEELGLANAGMDDYAKMLDEIDHI
jgi:hypothetical protein